MLDDEKFDEMSNENNSGEQKEKTELKIDLKLYKTFDADLISLNENGISLSAIIKGALYHFCRGEIAKYYIPECRPYDLSKLKKKRPGNNKGENKRYIHVIALINDPESIKLLKTEIKSRERSAFIRALIRESLVTQQFGVYFNNDARIQSETMRYEAIDLTRYDIVYTADFEERKHDYSSEDLDSNKAHKKRDYASEILKPAKKSKKDVKPETEKVSTPLPENAKEDAPDASAKLSNSFGDVSDLSFKEQQKKRTLSEMSVQREETTQTEATASLSIKEEEHPQQEVIHSSISNESGGASVPDEEIDAYDVFNSLAFD